MLEDEPLAVYTVIFTPIVNDPLSDIGRIVAKLVAVKHGESWITGVQHHKSISIDAKIKRVEMIS